MRKYKAAGIVSQCLISNPVAYYKAIIIKKYHSDTKTDTQINAIKSPEIKPCLYCQCTTKGARIYNE